MIKIEILLMILVIQYIMNLSYIIFLRKKEITEILNLYLKIGNPILEKVFLRVINLIVLEHIVKNIFFNFGKDHGQKSVLM